MLKHLIIACIYASLVVPQYCPAGQHNGDPWEVWNRKVFQFNDVVDTYTLKPVTKTYRFIFPKPVRGLFQNFLENIGEFRNITSAAAELEGRKAGHSATRLIINSTLGIGGLIDIASGLGFEEAYHDFGMTFAAWGIGAGPYLIIPLTGPSTMRALAGRVPAILANPVTYIKPDEVGWGIGVLDIIDTRDRIMDAERLIVGDRYAFLRDMYLQRRHFLITGEQPEDDF